MGKGKEKSRDCLLTMLDIYQPNGIDWMGYKQTAENTYTYHHIWESSRGGLKEVQNGAILTKSAHVFLNYLFLNCPEAYDDYQDLFRRINAIDGPIPPDLWEDIYGMLLDIEYYEEYKVLDTPLKFHRYKSKKKVKK